MPLDDEIFRDRFGRFTGAGAYAIPAAAEPTRFTSLLEANGALRGALQDADDMLVSAKENHRSGAVVLRASPGAGKSTVQRMLMAERQDRGQTRKTTTHLPTLALAEEAARHATELGLSARVIRGRSALRPDGQGRMCMKAATVERAIHLGLRAKAAFCESPARLDADSNGAFRCEHFDTCAYRKQFLKRADHDFVATTYLGLPDPEGDRLSYRVVDETFWRHALRNWCVDVAIFTAPRIDPIRPKSHQPRDARTVARTELLEAANKVVGRLMAGDSPLSLPYTAEDYEHFAELEDMFAAAQPDIAPAQSETEQRGLLDDAERDFSKVGGFRAVWRVLRHARENGLGRSERLRLERNRAGLKLHVAEKQALSNKEPMLVLDADAEPGILDTVGCPVLIQNDITLRPNAVIRQLHDRRMSTSAVIDSAENRNQWRSIIAMEVLRDRLGRNTGVLVGATKKVVQQFFADAGHDFSGMDAEEVSRFMLDTSLHGARWLWFGSRSLGSNAYADCSSVIVIGREELPLAALEDQGRALWGDTAGAPLTLLSGGPAGELWMPDAELAYEMTDGRAMAVRVPCHPDPRIRLLQRQAREFATRQLVERLRLARSPYPKRVLLGSSVPIPGLPVDQLVSWSDLQVPRLEAALAVGLLRDGAVELTHSKISAAASEVFCSQDAVKGFMKRDRASAGRLNALKR